MSSVFCCSCLMRCSLLFAYSNGPSWFIVCMMLLPFGPDLVTRAFASAFTLGPVIPGQLFLSWHALMLDSRPTGLLFNVGQSVWHRLFLRNVLLALGFFGSIRSNEPKHLLLQLRIHLVRNRHNVGEQRVEIQITHVLVQHRKNADLQ
jgi:hypothetical protein